MPVQSLPPIDFGSDRKSPADEGGAASLEIVAQVSYLGGILASIFFNKWARAVANCATICDQMGQPASMTDREPTET